MSEAHSAARRRRGSRRVAERRASEASDFARLDEIGRGADALVRLVRAATEARLRDGALSVPLEHDLAAMLNHLVAAYNDRTPRLPS